MSYKTVEVELENGQVRPSGADTLSGQSARIAHHFGRTCSRAFHQGESLADLAREFKGIGNGTHTDLLTHHG